MVLVGRNLKYHLIPPPCDQQGHLPLDWVTLSPVQPSLEPGECYSSLFVCLFFKLNGLLLNFFKLALFRLDAQSSFHTLEIIS